MTYFSSHHFQLNGEVKDKNTKILSALHKHVLGNCPVAVAQKR